jgi:hypothetical protein
MWLDKKRTFKLTPASIAREPELAGEDLTGIRQLAGTVWLFLIDEDPGLTVGAVERILRSYLSRGWTRFRALQVRRLRTRLGAMLQQYLAEAKHGHEV